MGNWDILLLIVCIWKLGPFPFLVALQCSYSEQEKATKWQIIINCFSLSADKWPFSSAWNFSEKPTLFKPAGITVPVVAKLYLTIQLRPQFSENDRFTLKRLGQNIKHRKNCECCHHHSLFKGHNVNVNIVVLNCQKWNQCLKCQVSGHRSLGLFFEGVL